MATMWEERYSTGDEKIDEQHQKLFQHVADLEKQLGNERIDPKAVKATLTFLEWFARLHFVYEEFCMLQHRCPAHEKNQAAHDAFKVILERFKQQHAAQGATRELVKQIYEAMTKWLVGHICAIDTRLKPCMVAGN